MATKKWSDLTSGQQKAVLVAGCVQLALAATAWADLARRPAGEVAGSKARWAAIIAINFVGPLSYFARGRRLPSETLDDSLDESLDEDVDEALDTGLLGA